MLAGRPTRQRQAGYEVSSGAVSPRVCERMRVWVRRGQLKYPWPRRLPEACLGYVWVQVTKLGYTRGGPRGMNTRGLRDCMIMHYAMTALYSQCPLQSPS